jgi:hypothetical protein
LDKFKCEVKIQIVKKKEKSIGGHARLSANKRADLSFEPGHLSWPAPLRPTFEQA